MALASLPLPDRNQFPSLVVYFSFFVDCPVVTCFTLLIGAARQSLVFICRFT